MLYVIPVPVGAEIEMVPVDPEQSGCIIELTVGAGGVGGWALITTSTDCNEEHPPTFVTVKLYVPVIRSEIVTLLVFPVIPPGLIVQFLGGKPLNITLPVETLQVGCVIAPTTGVDGTKGCVLITIFSDTAEVHPTSLVTVKL